MRVGGLRGGSIPFAAMDDSRSTRRDAALLLVAFVGSLLLLAGLAFALAQRPPSDGIASSGSPQA